MLGFLREVGSVYLWVCACVVCVNVCFVEAAGLVMAVMQARRDERRKNRVFFLTLPFIHSANRLAS